MRALLVALMMIANVAAAEDCVFCENEAPMNQGLYPFPAEPRVVVPDKRLGESAARYLDNKRNIESENMAIYKYNQGILTNPSAQQAIGVDMMMQDLRRQLQNNR